MTHKAPPTPPANRSPKGPGDRKEAAVDQARRGRSDPNTQEQGRQGNIHQNTTNKGYQQDR
jgi:hypothetical protein